MVFIAGYGVVVHRCGTCEFVAPRVYGGGTPRDDCRGKMIFHVVAHGAGSARGVVLVGSGLGLSIVVRVYSHGG